MKRMTRHKLLYFYVSGLSDYLINKVLSTHYKFFELRANRYDFRLTNKEIMLYQSRFDKVFDKLLALRGKNTFRGDYYDLPKGYKSLYKWALFYRIMWGSLNDIVDYEVKFVNSLEEALENAHVLLELISIMDTDTGKELTVAEFKRMNESNSFVSESDR